MLATVGLTCQIQLSQLDRPTPCGNWTLADLLAHLTGQQVGFAAAATGAGAPLATWVPIRSADPVVGYLRACTEVLNAFAEPAVAGQEFALPELRAGRGFPAEQAISFHLLDNVVHAWDLAVTLGTSLELRPELLQAAVQIARQVPDGPERLQPSAAFAPGQPVPDQASPLATILLLLGRSPGWPD